MLPMNLIALNAYSVFQDQMFVMHISDICSCAQILRGAE
jgi:hypothetical protein